MDIVYALKHQGPNVYSFGDEQPFFFFQSMVFFKSYRDGMPKSIETRCKSEDKHTKVPSLHLFFFGATA